jgi:hypothetical protein
MATLSRCRTEGVPALRHLDLTMSRIRSLEFQIYVCVVRYEVLKQASGIQMMHDDSAERFSWKRDGINIKRK